MEKSFCGFPHAVGADPVSISFESDVPDFSGVDFERRARDFYNAEALRLLGVLSEHLPGGLLDALFGQLCLRKASIYRVIG